MYAGIKTAIGPTIKKTAPLRSKDGVTLTKRADQMNRWIQHFSDLYGTERPYTAPAIDKAPSMEIMEVELDDEPHFTEMEAVVARLSNNNASDRDAIPTDLIKPGRQVLLSPLYSLLLKCWREHTQSHRPDQGWQTSIVIITLQSTLRALARTHSPTDLTKAGRPVLLSSLYSLLLERWREHTVPQT